MKNFLALNGFAFVEFSSPNKDMLLHDMCKNFDLALVASHKQKQISWYQSQNINFFINEEENSHGQIFSSLHGPSASSMAFFVKDAFFAIKELEKRGAENYQKPNKLFDIPAILGIGQSLIYLIDDESFTQIKSQFNWHDIDSKNCHLEYIDHLTHNLYRGNLEKWANFYKDLFDFKEIRYFDIKGSRTGLISRAMQSPCGKISIPLNEGTDDKSQIEEYLHAYKGEGIQHIAFHTSDIYNTVKKLKENSIKFLHTPNTYFELIEKRLPGHGEDLNLMKELKILIDGEINNGQKLLLLQIFTKNILGPIFFEIIQRKGHNGFGEGNFQALFEAIELDQIRRGVLS